MPPFLLAALPFIIREVGPIIMREVVARVGSDNPENVKRVTEQVSAEVAANPPAAVKEAAASVVAPKPAWQSVGVWGGVLTTIIGMFGMAGITLDWIRVTEDGATLAAGAVFVTGLVAAWGRYRATRPVK